MSERKGHITMVGRVLRALEAHPKGLAVHEIIAKLAAEGYLAEAPQINSIVCRMTKEARVRRGTRRACGECHTGHQVYLITPLGKASLRGEL